MSARTGNGVAAYNMPRGNNKMQLCIISQSSITYAVKARDALADSALPSRIIKLDPSRTRRGCAYGLEIDCRMVNSAALILDRRGIPYSEIVGPKA